MTDPAAVFIISWFGSLALMAVVVTAWNAWKGDS